MRARTLRVALAMAVVGGALGLGAGCNGYSSEQANNRCDAERMARGSEFDDKSFDDCIQCFEQCGDSCVASNSAPVRFSCSDNSAGATPE
ncbi:MAG TPA: hypothetical protein VHB21_16630 [Minicystis sp.]|nr:hypothetical protein [Minicystis sp.]